MVEISVPRKPEEVTAMTDDGVDSLSAARWLRPPQSATSWWDRVPKDWSPGETQHWAEYTGTSESMPAGTYAARAERDTHITAKCWSKKVRTTIRDRVFDK